MISIDGGKEVVMRVDGDHLPLTRAIVYEFCDAIGASFLMSASRTRPELVFFTFPNSHEKKNNDDIPRNHPVLVRIFKENRLKYEKEYKLVYL